MIPALVDDLPKALAVLKAFTTYFQLVNLAEDEQRTQVLRRRTADAQTTGVPGRETIEEAITRLKQEGVTADEMRATLSSLFIRPVLTAHPTETKRQAILTKLRTIAATLRRLNNDDLLPLEASELTNRLREDILLLWQSDETRDRPPTVLDEVRTGLYFFEATLYHVLPEIYSEFARALALAYPGEKFDVPTFLRYGSWIGGDRDGNPFVTVDVTEQALRTMKEVDSYALQRCGRRTVSSPDSGRDAHPRSARNWLTASPRTSSSCRRTRSRCSTVSAWSPTGRS